MLPLRTTALCHTANEALHRFTGGPCCGFLSGDAAPLLVANVPFAPGAALVAALNLRLLPRNASDELIELSGLPKVQSALELGIATCLTSG